MLQGKEYYDYCLSKGIDLNYFGDWQINYVKMLVHCTNIVPVAANNQKKGSIFFDFGTGCGLHIRAMKELNIFTKCCGIDIDEYLVNLGRETHGLSEEELFVHDISTKSLPFADDSITLLHSSQVLEHIDEKQIDRLLNEFKRILSKDGICFLTIASVDKEDITHINLKNKQWWDNKIKKYFKQNPGIKMRFQKSPFSPDNSSNNFNYYYGESWYVYGLKK
jgi:ubiquinone/menaquinone biosynthesis C-methylase UbiE